MICSLAVLLVGLLAPAGLAQQRPKLPKPQQLDRSIRLERDPATGELRYIRAEQRAASTAESAPDSLPSASATIRLRVNLVEVGCNVFAPDGSYVRGLGRNDFRIFDDGIEEQIAHFDASNEPASITLVLDSSPSVYRDLQQVKEAARTLVANLSPLDEVAVVAFATHTHVLLPFSRDREMLERAIASVQLARRPSDASGSNIYEAVYLTARELFGGRRPIRPTAVRSSDSGRICGLPESPAGPESGSVLSPRTRKTLPDHRTSETGAGPGQARQGRKAIVLLTDGQDSGLGLSWDPASAAPQPGETANRLTFEDVCRALTAAGVEVYAVSTENRPKAMTQQWLATHRNEMLITRAAHEQGMVHYTLYLAELVRRAGGRLYFLRELGTLPEVYRRIAENLRAQYTLGYYPSSGAQRPGWHSLRVEVQAGSPRRDLRVTHRVAYYVPASP